MNEIGIVIKGTQSFVTLLQLREDTMRRWQSAAQKRILTWTWTHWPPISDFQPPELWEIDLFIDWCCCCSWVASIVSNSVRPHRRQPTRPPRPWDSPGKITGVGCHFLLQRMKVKSESEVTQSCPTLSNPMTAAYQAPPSMGFSRQEYWSGVPLPSPYRLLV